MIPAPFDYARPDSVDEALDLLAEHGDDAKLLAGGHSLLPMMKLRLAAPEVLVDIGRLAELSYIRVEGDERGHRRGDPPPRPSRRPRCCAARCRCWPRRPAGRRPAGPPPRHDRRLARARRPGRRPARGAARAADGTWSLRGPVGRARDRRATSSSAATSRPRWRRTSCSSRSGCRAAGPAGLGVPEVHPAGQRLGDRRRSRPSAGGWRWPTWARRRCGRRHRAGAGGGGVDRRRRRGGRTRKPTRPRTCTPTPPTAATWSRVLTRRALTTAAEVLDHRPGTPGSRPFSHGESSFPARRVAFRTRRVVISDTARVAGRPGIPLFGRPTSHPNVHFARRRRERGGWGSEVHASRAPPTCAGPPSGRGPAAQPGGSAGVWGRERERSRRSLVVVLGPAQRRGVERGSREVGSAPSSSSSADQLGVPVVRAWCNGVGRCPA